MTGAPLRWAWLLVATVLLTGIAATVVALRAREGNPEFTAAQRALQPVAGSGIAGIILKTSDPRPGDRGRVVSAHCQAGSDSPLGNPWNCLVRYPSPPLVRYRVDVHGDGSISGTGQQEGVPLRGILTLTGCCVTTSA